MQNYIDWVGYLAMIFILFAPVFFLIIYFVWETLRISLERRIGLKKKGPTISGEPFLKVDALSIKKVPNTFLLELGGFG